MGNLFIFLQGESERKAGITLPEVESRENISYATLTETLGYFKQCTIFHDFSQGAHQNFKIKFQAFSRFSRHKKPHFPRLLGHLS